MVGAETVCIGQSEGCALYHGYASAPLRQTVNCQSDSAVRMLKSNKLTKSSGFPVPKAPRITVAGKRRIKLRREIWPDVKNFMLWDRKTFSGFTTIPRTLPIIMKIIDSLDSKKAGRTYFDLWCRAFDDYVIDLRDEAEAAYQSGYSGQRAVRSWRERVDILEQNGFIKLKKGPTGTYRYILLLDPHDVVDELNNKSKIDTNDYEFFRAHMINIGAI